MQCVIYFCLNDFASACIHLQSKNQSILLFNLEKPCNFTVYSMCCLTHFNIWADVFRWLFSTPSWAYDQSSSQYVSDRGVNMHDLLSLRTLNTLPRCAQQGRTHAVSHHQIPAVRKMARAGALSCIFARRCDVTAGETGNSWDYLTSTFHRADLRMEPIPGAIREKKQEEPIKKGKSVNLNYIPLKHKCLKGLSWDGCKFKHEINWSCNAVRKCEKNSLINSVYHKRNK